VYLINYQTGEYRTIDQVALCVANPALLFQIGVLFVANYFRIARYIITKSICNLSQPACVSTRAFCCLTATGELKFEFTSFTQ
jgi:hypothetical protein